MANAYTIDSTASDNTYTRNIIMNSLTGVEGIPYQFMESVDRRLTSNNTLSSNAIGRKYAERIISRIPLLFMTPCQPLFMDDFNKEDRDTVIQSLISGMSDAASLTSGTGRYYSVEFAYSRYYDYLNLMLGAISSFLGIQDETIQINGVEKKIGSINWASETSNSFKTYFSSKENLVFYLDAMESVSESFSNSTTQSSLASTINGLSDTAKEIEFLFGSSSSNAISTAIGGTSDIVSSITSSLASGLEGIGGGIVSSLASDGISSVLNGGKIMFPDIWSDSSYDKSYTIDIKLRSPDNDSLSIFLNILKPYCKLLALVLPHSFKNNPNGYRAPFLVKAYSKGLFNIDMGMVQSMSVTKGAACCWNDDGLPTQIDISLDIVDLYKSLAMSGFTDDDDSASILGAFNIFNKIGNVKSTVVSNTAYMDFLANTAGLNINQMQIGRRTKMFYYLMKNSINTMESTASTRFDQAISKIIGGIYKFF